MKKVIVIMVMVLLVPAFLSAHSIEEVELYDGCVVLWRPDVFRLSSELNVPAFLPETFCANIPLLWVHVDWCTDGEKGEIVTATPNKGTVDFSTFEDRWRSGIWNKCAVLVNPYLDLGESMKRMEEIEGLPYDWVGYYLHVLDLLSCSQKTFFRNLRDPILEWYGISVAYHCASHTFYIVNYQQPHITTPHDFYHDAVNENVDSGWIITGVYDIE